MKQIRANINKKNVHDIKNRRFKSICPIQPVVERQIEILEFQIQEEKQKLWNQL